MLRFLRMNLAILSLIVAIIAAFLWVRSYRAMDLLQSGTYDGTRYDDWTLVSARGRLQFQHRINFGDGNQPPQLAYASLPPKSWDDDLPWNVWHRWSTAENRSTFCVVGLGFERQLENSAEPEDCRPLAIAVPHGLIIFVGGLAGWWFIPRRSSSNGRGFAIG